MKASTVLFIGLGAAVVGGMAYRNGAYAMTFAVADVKIAKNGDIGLMIAVNNPSRFFSYPVPGLFFNVYDSQSNYLGSLRSDIMQWIGANGTSFIYAWLLPNYMQIGPLLQNFFLPNSTADQLVINGVLKISSYQIPVETVLKTK